jgi:hypothetical protein
MTGKWHNNTDMLYLAILWTVQIIHGIIKAFCIDSKPSIQQGSIQYVDYICGTFFFFLLLFGHFMFLRVSERRQCEEWVKWQINFLFCSISDNEV